MLCVGGEGSLTAVTHLLHQPLIRTILRDGRNCQLTLPGLLVAMARDDVTVLPALRPFQHHPWHAFLVQLASLALGPASQVDLVGLDEEDWIRRLRSLTRAYPGDEPWDLVVGDLAQPAFMQSPIPDRSLERYRKEAEMPDDLDVLVSTRQHDVKSGQMRRAGWDSWLFALVSLQTQQGYTKNYGISRMNGGFGSRVGVGLEPMGGIGARWLRDTRHLCASLANEVSPAWEGYDPLHGIRLVWLEPWLDSEQLSRQHLHPLYIEICRRIRLTHSQGHVTAWQGGTRMTRIVPPEKGQTGDPWMPHARVDGRVFTPNHMPFGYQRMSQFLFGLSWTPSLLGIPQPDERGSMVLGARTIVRGKGKTEGYSERRVDIPAGVIIALAKGENEAIAEVVEARLEVVAQLIQALQGASVFYRQRRPTDALDFEYRDFSYPYVKRLQRFIEDNFFPLLWQECQESRSLLEPSRAKEDWMRRLRQEAMMLLEEMAFALPLPERFRYRSLRTATNAFNSLLQKASRWRSDVSSTAEAGGLVDGEEATRVVSFATALGALSPAERRGFLRQGHLAPTAVEKALAARLLATVEVDLTPLRPAALARWVILGRALGLLCGERWRVNPHQDGRHFARVWGDVVSGSDFSLLKDRDMGVHHLVEATGSRFDTVLLDVIGLLARRQVRSVDAVSLWAAIIYRYGRARHAVRLELVDQFFTYQRPLPESA